MSHPRFPIPRLHLPMRRPEDVIPCLRGGARHRWQRHSAHALGTTWSRANGLPAAVPLVLDGHARFAGAELVDAFLERTVDLRDGYRPSQADLLAVLGIAEGLAVMVVEGKVRRRSGHGATVARHGRSRRRRRCHHRSGALRSAPFPMS